MPRNRVSTNVIDTSPNPVPRTGAAFRRHYDELERNREALIERLKPFTESAGAPAAYRRASRLLNQTFRRATLAQRGVLLQSAACLIELMERLPPLA